MATTLSKVILTGSTNGLGIKVAATATAGTTIHTAIAGTTSMDEIWLYAMNSSTTTDVNLTLEWGGVGAPDDNIFITIPAYSGLILVAPGLLLRNTLIVKAFASVANVVTIHGYVNRITIV